MTDTKLSRTRKAGVYAYALDWHKLGWLALAGAAAAKYIDPVLLAAVAPAVAKQVFANLTQAATAVRLANANLAEYARQLAQVENFANEGKGESE